jgi:hypothetical protein
LRECEQAYYSDSKRLGSSGSRGETCRILAKNKKVSFFSRLQNPGPSLLKTGIGFMSDDIEHGLGGASKLHQSGLALESIAGAEIGFPGQLELDLVFGNRIR